LIILTPEAAAQVEALQQHYEALHRGDALLGLIRAIETAWRKIETDPASGLLSPRPYPQLARTGRRWIKTGRYWVAYHAAPRRPLSACSMKRPTFRAASSAA